MTIKILLIAAPEMSSCYHFLSRLGCFLAGNDDFVKFCKEHMQENTHRTNNNAFLQ